MVYMQVSAEPTRINTVRVYHRSEPKTESPKYEGSVTVFRGFSMGEEEREGAQTGGLPISPLTSDGAIMLLFVQQKGQE